MAEKNNTRETNKYDIFIAIINGLFNLNLSKVSAIGLLWLIIRDIICLSRLPKDYDYSEWMLSTNKTLEYIFSNDNLAINTMSVIIVICFILIVLLFGRVLYLQKEVKRISQVRSDVMHGLDRGIMQAIAEHASTEME